MKIKPRAIPPIDAPLFPPCDRLAATVLLALAIKRRVHRRDVTDDKSEWAGALRELHRDGWAIDTDFDGVCTAATGITVPKGFRSYETFLRKTVMGNHDFTAATLEGETLERLSRFVGRCQPITITMDFGERAAHAASLVLLE